jgi:hypothetical protein
MSTKFKQETLILELSVEQIKPLIISVVNDVVKDYITENFKKEVIDTKELCKRLNITSITLNRWRKKEKIPYMMIGNSIRYEWFSVIKALENKKGGSKLV